MRSNVIIYNRASLPGSIDSFLSEPTVMPSAAQPFGCVPCVCVPSAAVNANVKMIE